MKQNPIEYLQELCNTHSINNLYYEDSNTMFIYGDDESSNILKIDLSKMDRQCPNINASTFKGIIHIVASVDGELGISGLMPTVVVANELMFSDSSYGGLILLPTHYSSQKIKVNAGYNYHRFSDSTNVINIVSFCPTQCKVNGFGKFTLDMYGVPVVAGMFAEKRKFKDPRELVCITTGGYTGNYYGILNSVSKDPNHGIFSLFVHMYKVSKLFSAVINLKKRGSNYDV
jgi:hypothetical protein